MFATSLAARTDVEIGLRLDHSNYVLGEAISGVLTIKNHGAQPFIVDDHPAYEGNRVLFDVRRQRSDRVLPLIGGDSVLDELTVFPGDSQTFRVDLASMFPMGQEGRYHLKAIVQFGSRRFESAMRSLDIVPGMLLAEATRPIVNVPDSRRTYRLVFWTRNRAEVLFLRASDSPGGVLWQTISLGPLVRFSDVEIDTDQPGEVTVRHQASRDIHLVSIIESRAAGLRLLGQRRDEDHGTTPLRRALRGEFDAPQDTSPARRWWQRR